MPIFEILSFFSYALYILFRSIVHLNYSTSLYSRLFCFLSKCTQTSPHSQTCTLQEYHINIHMGFKAATIHFLLVIAVFLYSLTHKRTHTRAHTSTHIRTNIHMHAVYLIEEKVVQRDRTGGVCAWAGEWRVEPCGMNHLTHEKTQRKQAVCGLITTPLCS